MNCYEWRKHITGSVSVNLSYSETGEGFTISGSGTITHATLYTGWTRRELQCVGAPLTTTDPWILRGPNLCEGRALIEGVLPPSGTIAVTYTTEGLPPVVEQWSIFWQIIGEDYRVLENTLLPVSPYPDWENDPYSVAYRAQIDGLTQPALRVGFGPSPPAPGAPAANSAPVRWLKNGESGTSENGFLSASLEVSFTLA